MIDERSKRRAVQRRYYLRNRRVLIAKQKVLDSRRTKHKDKDQETQAYQRAKIVLRGTCRPDLHRIALFRRRFPTAAWDHLKLDPEDEVRRERIYKEKLVALRLLFHRDPETGRKLPPEEPPHALVGKSVYFRWNTEDHSGKVVYVGKDGWAYLVNSSVLGGRDLWVQLKNLSTSPLH